MWSKSSTSSSLRSLITRCELFCLRGSKGQHFRLLMQLCCRQGGVVRHHDNRSSMPDARCLCIAEPQAGVDVPTAHRKVLGLTFCPCNRCLHVFLLHKGCVLQRDALCGLLLGGHCAAADADAMHEARMRRAGVHFRAIADQPCMAGRCVGTQALLCRLLASHAQDAHLSAGASAAWSCWALPTSPCRGHNTT